MGDPPPQPPYSPAQQALVDVWEQHLAAEFGTRDVDGSLATMVEDAYVNHIPVLTGGVGKEA